MSGGTSAIVNLYIAIYGHAPSSQTTKALIRAEQVLGITKGDALARFYVVLLHSADRIDDAIGQRKEDEKEFIKNLRGATRNLATIVREVDDAGRKVMRTAKQRGSLLSDDDVVAVDRSASPLFAYLRHAFYFTSIGEDDEERISAARLDLLATVVLLVFSAGAIWGMFRLFPV
ncbi:MULTISPECIES: hypothetical protein [Sphingomonas]|uniref:Uncharacterized protein n=1 Tax=Sphingomonas hankookensis TaxID=563996 RepID=A0ABR5Y8P3_9SPHN|nr:MULTISPECIES: hypothetical protein [Sphingomonas]KZE10901.1 hypothetical protein AVT10_05995 [Sphingomonas hankookensis]PZU80862.1 MAG: hypothetical protein DI530_04680 [Sphingomonas sp.]RSV29432.1 hypothetical protein CA237_09175 [Sphingomonas sp. ABOLH]